MLYCDLDLKMKLTGFDHKKNRLQNHMTFFEETIEIRLAMVTQGFVHEKINNRQLDAHTNAPKKETNKQAEILTKEIKSQTLARFMNM